MTQFIRSYKNCVCSTGGDNIIMNDYYLVRQAPIRHLYGYYAERITKNNI